MKNPPAATAAVADHEPVRTAAPAQAMVVVTRWPPGLMSSPNATLVPPLDHPFGAAAHRRLRSGVPGMGLRLPVRPRLLYTRLSERFSQGGDGCRGMSRWRFSAS